MKHFAAVFALAALFSASEVAAQVSEESARQALDEPFNGRRPALVYAIQSGEQWSLVAVFSQPFGATAAMEPAAPRRWVARRQTGNGDSFSGAVTWADSDACPQIEGVLWSLHQAEIPSFNIPGITAVRPPAGVEPSTVPTHSPVFTIWGQGDQASGALAWMRIQPFGGELTQWGLNAERHLSDCWSSEMPVVDRRN
jgi:hypothetical protein